MVCAEREIRTLKGILILNQLRLPISPSPHDSRANLFWPGIAWYKDRISRTSCLFGKRDSNSQMLAATSRVFQFPPFPSLGLASFLVWNLTTWDDWLIWSEKQDSNLRPPASNAGKQPPLSSQKFQSRAAGQKSRVRPTIFDLWLSTHLLRETAETNTPFSADQSKAQQGFWTCGTDRIRTCISGTSIRRIDHLCYHSVVEAAGLEPARPFRDLIYSQASQPVAQRFH